MTISPDEMNTDDISVSHSDALGSVCIFGVLKVHESNSEAENALNRHLKKLKSSLCVVTYCGKNTGGGGGGCRPEHGALISFVVGGASCSGLLIPGTFGRRRNLVFST